MSRSVARAVSRLVAALIVLGVAAVAVVVVVEVVAAALGSSGAFVDRDAWLERARTTRWADAAVRTTALLLVLSGLALLALALWPRHDDTLDTAAGPATGVRRRDALRALRRAAQVDGVHHPSVRLGGRDARVVDVRARTSRSLPGDVDDRLRSAVQAEATRIGLDPEVRVAVRRERSERDRGLVPAGAGEARDAT